MFFKEISYMIIVPFLFVLAIIPFIKKVAIHVAINSDYLTVTGGLTDFTIKNLLFYETYTPFVRGIYSTNDENFKLGFRDKTGKESPQSCPKSTDLLEANLQSAEFPL